MKKRHLKLLSFLILTAMLFAGCAGTPSSAPAAAATSAAAPATSAAAAATSAAPAEAPAEEALDPYTFTVYHNFDYQVISNWGADETSKYWAEKFNITMEQTKPDANADAKLNLMVASGDLPDVVRMSRNAVHMQVARQGAFIDLAPLQAVNPSFDQEIAESTRDLLKIDGVLYIIPHWSRKAPTGGNDMWLYNQRIYEAAGSPALNTFEGLYDYAKYVKDNIPTTNEGLPTIPFATQNNNDAFWKITFAFYRSMGGPGTGADYTARVGGEIKSVLRDATYKAAVLEANRWYRDGLISETQFVDTTDQMIEKFTTGRTALLYYDHSQDSVNRFRQILMETYPGDTYGQVIDPVYPPAEGVTKVYADLKESPGGTALSITTAAEKPQRIFDLFTYMLTKQGSIEMMYGPQGDWWDELDANGDPILKMAESEMSTDEKNRIGSWMWSICSHSDNVDSTKYAVNAMQPPEKQDWVISTQMYILTPIMYMTDEYNGFNTSIDPQSDLGIQRTLCTEQFKAEIPKAIMASSADEASKIFDALLAFYDANNFAEVEKTYNERHNMVVGIQGFSAFSDYDALSK